MTVSIEQAQHVLETAELLYTGSEIEVALDDLADKINHAVKGIQNDQPVIVISVMNGGMVITGQLITRLDFPLQVDFIHATRYRNQTMGGELEWKVEPHQSIQGRNLIILDDILDEGYTLDAVVKYCYEKGAAHVMPAVLVEKKHERRKPGVSCDFIGLEVEDRYVFGFGMDYKGYHRNVDAIYAVSDQFL